MKRIIVSGANGFLGSNIINIALKEKQSQVVAITSKTDKFNDIKTINTDVFLKQGMDCSVDDIFINCLFPTNSNGYELADGLRKVFQIITMAKRSGVGAFINISSQSVYASKRTTPATEEDKICLESAYSVGKYCSEIYCARELEGIPFTNLRMASLIGIDHQQRIKRIVNRLVKQALKGEDLIIIGGKQKYGFLDVRDAAVAVLKIALSDSSEWKQIYNIGRMEYYTLIDLAEIIVKSVKKLTGIEVNYAVTEGEDIRNSSIDITKFSTDFGWQPEIKINETIEEIIASECGSIGSY